MKKYSLKTKYSNAYHRFISLVPFVFFGFWALVPRSTVCFFTADTEQAHMATHADDACFNGSQRITFQNKLVVDASRIARDSLGVL